MINEVIKSGSQSSFALVFLGIALLVFVGLVISLFKLSRNENIASLFGSVVFRRRILIAQAIVIIIVIMFALWALEYNRQQVSKARQIEIETVLKTTTERLHIWEETQKLTLEDQVNHIGLKVITEQLLAVQTSPSSLQNSDALMAARKYYSIHLEKLGKLGFFIINPERINIGSMRDGNLGAVNLIEQQQSELLARVFQGETLIIPPIQSNVPLGRQYESQSFIPTMFIAAPIYNGQDKVIAVFAKRQDVANVFSQVFESGRYGITAESYAFDRSGRLFSESLFNNDLEKISLLEEGQRSALNIYARDPGGNLMEGYQPSIARNEQPLTHMAASAVLGKSGTDMKGYRDYRGVPVIGTWQWIDHLNIGVATEIDVDEAYASYYAMRWTVFGLLALVLIVAISGATFTLFLGEKASLILRRSRDELGALVDERTIELELEVKEHKRTEAHLQASETEYRNILESLQDVYYRADNEGRFVMLSPSVQSLTGYLPEELIGLPVTDFWRYPEKRQQMLEAMQLGNGAVQHMEIEGIDKDGKVIWGSTNSHFYRDENGDIVGIEGTIRDVTERKAVERELLHNRALMQSLYDSIPDLIFAKNMSGVYIQANKAFSSLVGTEREKIIGFTDYDLFPKEVADFFKSKDQKMLAAGKAMSNEEWVDYPDGRRVLLDTLKTPFHSLEGEMLGLLGISRDITQRKQEAQALEQFKDTLDQTIDGVFMFDAETLNFIYVNEGAVQQLGYTRQEFLSMCPCDIKPYICEAQFREMLAPMVAGEQSSLTFEAVHQHKSGKLVEVEISLQYMVPKDEVPRFIAIARDITESKVLKERLDRAMEAANAGIWDWSTVTGEVYTGDLWSTMLGYTSTELVEKYGPHFDRWKKLMHPDDLPGAIKEVKKHINGETNIYKTEFRMRTADGQWKWLQSIGKTTERDANGIGIRLVGVHLDINEAKVMQVEILNAKEEAERANQAKSEFLSSMSHELRTPLNAILGLSQLFEYDKNLTATQKSNAREIDKAGSHLLTLINEVLDLAKVESGHLELSMEAVELSTVLEECRVLIAPLAESHNITLDFVSAQCKPYYISADNTRLKQVLLNLISNGVKYNRTEGYVMISCAETDRGSLRINVKDSGHGIAINQLSKLFQPFSRLGAEHGNREGTGIGLVITKQLVEMMGGTIGLDSVVGKGSTFWVEFNLSSSMESAPTFDNASITSSSIDLAETLPLQSRILIAEDNSANQVVLQQQMAILGLNADFADNGIQAFERWNNAHYDLLLTDIHMPLMNGYELVNRIRQAEQQTGTHMPIIAITANAMGEDAKRCLESGMDAFIAKPISLNELQAALKKWLPNDATTKESKNTHAVGDETNTESPVDISMLISLVGDDKDKHCLLFKSFLESTPEIIQAIQAAYKDHAAEIIKQQAHKLKSPARSMGANELADVCQGLESAGKLEQWEEIDRLVPQLNELFERVDAYIENYCRPTPITEPTNTVSIEQIKVLLLDDERMTLDLEMMTLNGLGVNDVVTADRGEDALKIIAETGDSVDIVMCDLNMPEMDGMEFLRHLSDQNYTGGVILVSGEDLQILKMTEKLATEHKLNVLGVIEKPVTPTDVKKALEKLKKTPAKQQPKRNNQNQIMVSAKELEHGINNDELVTFFQPKIDVVTREIVGMETLVRWQHPEKGMIAPNLFISVAEENGLIEMLTKDVFIKAMQQTATLKAAGFNLKVAVNISVDTLNDLSWPDFAMHQTSMAGLETSDVTIEITESRLMDNLASALEILTRLRMKQFKLSIDDFGTGYSSMEQLQRIPFSELKIDRAFVNGAAHDKAARAILEASVELAKKLNMSIVAEGVETQEDWDLIASLGCDQVQGYFIAKPMPIDDLKNWLSQRNK